MRKPNASDIPLPFHFTCVRHQCFTFQTAITKVWGVTLAQFMQFHLYWCCLLSPSSMKKLISLLCVPLVLFSIQYLVRMHVCTRRGRKFPAISFYLIRSVSQAQRQVNQSQNNRTDETESNWCHTHHNKPSHPNMQSALWFNLRHVSHKKSSSTVFITSRKKFKKTNFISS